MNKSFLLALAAALMAAPMAFAHDPSGTLKNYCEDPSEWNVHDYAPPASGHLIFLGQDGNLVGDCNGDGIVADYDLHIEFAFGGAWLTVFDVPDCNSETGHHPNFGPITVEDTIFGTTVAFWVASDTINAIPPTDPNATDCGDFESDNGSECVGTCTVTFAAGLDGTYQVYVGGGVSTDPPGASVGVKGHIISGTGGQLPECSDGIDNDNDGGTDYDSLGLGGGDAECTSANDDSESA